MKTLLLALMLSLPLQAQARALVLTTQNTVTYRGPVNGESATTAMLQLQAAVKARGKATYPIYLVLDSPGGSIMAGSMFIDFVRLLPNVHTVTMFSASMAAGIVEALPGKRYITKNGILMFHRARGGFEGQFNEGELESQLRLWKAIVTAMEQVNADRCSMPLSEYKDKVVNEWWMYGQEAVDQKAADEAVDLVCTQELLNSRSTLVIDGIFGSFKLSFSGCPLIRVPLPELPEEEEETEEEEEEE